MHSFVEIYLMFHSYMERKMGASLRTEKEDKLICPDGDSICKCWKNKLSYVKILYKSMGRRFQGISLILIESDV